MSSEQRLVLVTGVTGYIGGRLVPELLKAGYAVRALARHPERLRDQPWRDEPGVEVVKGDASDAQSLAAAMDGVDIAYYLIHALGTGRDFAARDRDTARTFGQAARVAGVSRIVYLGGLYPKGERLSDHLASRKEVGDILLASSAGMPAEVSRAFDIGGPEVLTYRDMMQRYAAVAGLAPRRIIPTPLLTPSLSSHWVGLVTPVPNSIARPLVDSLVHDVVCQEHDIAEYVPDPETGLAGFERAVELALTKIQNLEVATRWSSAATIGAPSDPLPSDPDWAGGSLYTDDRSSVVQASREALWSVIEGVGGDNGWYSWRLGWVARGLMDRIFGGPGLRRGRRHPQDLAVGDALDWWRVEEIEDLHLLRLRAEMRLPGLAWLELIAEEGPSGETVFRQRALFHPKGLVGHAYWAAVYPFHGIVFGGMQRNIAKAAEAAQRSGGPARWRPSGKAS